jgi:carbamoyl-phosphate synthase large subunit
VKLGVEHPVLIDKYILGKEIEVDAIADGEDILIPGVMEHVERTGVHSGDSISVYPPHTIPNEVADVLIDYTKRITRALNVVGLANIQYAWDGKDVYVIEVNPRASRTVPIISKVTGVPMVRLAMGAMLGEKLRDSAYGTGLYKKMKFTTVKMPVFSNAKLTDVDIALGPEMKSTGEILGIDETYEKAVYKGFLATGVAIPTEGGVDVSLRKSERTDASAAVVARYAAEGFRIYGSSGTARWLGEHGLETTVLESNEVRDYIASGAISIVINVPKTVNRTDNESFRVRRYATERNLPVLTCMDTAEAFLIAVTNRKNDVQPIYHSLEDWNRY